MNRRSIESNDIFVDNDWLGDIKDIENRLHAIKNPYRGNKRKMLVDLTSVLRENNINVDGKKVLDLFAGSSFVSCLFKSLGAAVWSNDLLAFSYLGSMAFIESIENYTTEQDIYELIWNDPKDASSYMREKYTDKRFTEQEAERLDIICRNLELKYKDLTDQELNLGNIVESINGIPRINYFAKPSKDLFHIRACSFAQEVTAILHYVIHNCDLGGRLNCGQVIAEVKHRLKRHSMSFNKILPYNTAFDNGMISVSTKFDAIDLLKMINNSVKFDFVYIDPPYGGDQSDYGHMYEICEDFLGHKIEKKNKQRFTKSKNYSENFKELLSFLPMCPWVFSYNDSSWASVDEIKKCIEDFGRKVSLHKVDYDYQYRAKDNAAGSEYVIVAES